MWNKRLLFKENKSKPVLHISLHISFIEDNGSYFWVHTHSTVLQISLGLWNSFIVLFIVKSLNKQEMNTIDTASGPVLFMWYADGSCSHQCIMWVYVAAAIDGLWLAVDGTTACNPCTSNCTSQKASWHKNSGSSGSGQIHLRSNRILYLDSRTDMPLGT